LTCGKLPPGTKPNECCGDHLPETCCRRVVAEARLAELYRDAGIGRALMADPQWTAGAMAEIERRAGLGEPFTAEDVRRTVGNPQERNAMGAVMAAAAAKGIIRRHGDRSAGRGSARRRRIGVWVGARAPEQAALEVAGDG
jgi:hypothetical protein